MIGGKSYSSYFQGWRICQKIIYLVWVQSKTPVQRDRHNVFYVLWSHPFNLLPHRSGMGIWEGTCWQCQPKCQPIDFLRDFLGILTSCRSNPILNHKLSLFYKLIQFQSEFSIALYKPNLTLNIYKHIGASFLSPQLCPPRLIVN